MTDDKKPDALVDLHRLSEDDRIDLIGHTVIAHAKTIAVVVDDIPSKIERYARKLTDRFPGLEIIERVKGPTPGAFTLKVGPRKH